jgi:hypothetical protein
VPNSLLDESRLLAKRNRDSSDIDSLTPQKTNRFRRFYAIPILAGVLLSAALVLYLSDYRRSPETYHKEAENYINSNDPMRAEYVLMEGLRRHPDDEMLKKDLLKLLRSSGRWTDLLQYLQIGSFHNIDTSSYYGAIASDFFDRKDWKNAARHYLKAAQKEEAYIRSYNAQQGEDRDFWLDCPFVSAEYYRNAGAAYYNMSDSTGLSEVIKIIESRIRGASFDCRETFMSSYKQILLDNLQELRSWYIGLI